jgi:hypothetical protein
LTDTPNPTPEPMEWEARAEVAYTAMYDAPDHDQKDLKDDALFYLARGSHADAAWLKAREANLMGVWNSQFRPVRR